jgi:RNA polymerase sigma factor (sigma-70 family)
MLIRLTEVAPTERIQPPTLDEWLMREERRRLIRQALSELPDERERRILRLLHGMDDGREWLHREIARDFGEYAKDIRQAEGTALRHLREGLCGLLMERRKAAAFRLVNG